MTWEQRAGEPPSSMRRRTTAMMMRVAPMGKKKAIVAHRFALGLAFAEATATVAAALPSLLENVEAASAPGSAVGPSSWRISISLSCGLSPGSEKRVT